MTLDGLMSRWMMPFWWACWIAWQTGTNSSSRWRGVRWLSSQYLVIGTPLTSSMTKYGRPGFRGPGVEDAGDVRVIHHRQGLPLGLEAGDDLRDVHARLDDLEGDLAADGLRLLGHEDGAHAAFADLLQAACTGRFACRGLREGRWKPFHRP